MYIYLLLCLIIIGFLFYIIVIYVMMMPYHIYNTKNYDFKIHCVVLDSMTQHNSRGQKNLSEATDEVDSVITKDVKEVL